MEIVPVTRKEKFIKAAIDGVPLSIDAIPRIEMYLAKISGDNVDLPDPITRIEKYLAVIAGMDVVLPSPVTRVEKYLAKIAGMDVETPEPVTRIEMLLDEWVESSGGVLKTVSGAVVSVSDALKKAIVSLVVSLEPIQSLNGYANPWPAGGGKNKCSMADQTFVQFLEVEIDEIPAGTYKYSAVVTSSDTDGTQCAIIFLDADKNALTSKSLSRSVGGSRISTEFTVSSPIKYLRLYASGGYQSGEGDTATFADNMICLASATDPTVFATYSNICPISGHESVKVTRTGKNLLNDSLRYVSPNGNTVYFGSNDGSYATYLKAGTYTISVDFSSEPYGMFYREANDGAGTRIWSPETGTTEKTFTIEEDGMFNFWAYRSVANGGVDPTKIIHVQLELGSTATAYEPYTGTTYSIDWTDEAGTVYGGELDVTNGVLTVDRAMVVYDGSEDETWNISSAWGKTNTAVFYSTAIRGAYYPDLTDYRGMLTNLFLSATRNYSRNNDVECCGFSGDAVADPAPTIRILKTRANTVTDFRTFLSTNNLQFCYELATPITIQLTPTEIEMLLGENTVWSENGDITLTYMADGNANDVEALNILLGNRYVNLGEPDEATDREALYILLGGR